MKGTGKTKAKVMAALVVLSLSLQAASFVPYGQTAHAAPATTIHVDGIHEADWGAPVGTDPQGDMHETNLDLSTLYLVDDAANFYIGFDASATTWGMHYGIAIDTDNVSGSGATSNPWGRAVDTVAARRPEYYLNVWHPGNGTIESAQLNHWDGGSWSFPSLTSLGGEQAYREDNHFIEYRIPKAALGGARTINLELFTTAGGGHAQDTVPSDPNVAYADPEFGNDTTTLSQFVSYTGVHAAAHDNNVEYDGLGHNSQDLIYRQPFGATNPGTQVTLRFRTFHNDVTSVRARFYDTTSSQEFYRDMQLVGDGIGCYQDSLASELCDYYETKVTPSQLTTLYYRFIITDGTAIAYYADDNFKDGGLGVATPNLVDNSYPITVFDPAFRPIPWMKDAVIYQIFPDRFRNGRSNNDPTGNEPRYGYPSDPLDRIIDKPWGSMPEGYCRDYINPAAPCTESPRGRDYF